MIKIQKSKSFQDEKCTCNCGNTHEFYGGKGYKTIDAQGYTDGKGGGHTDGKGGGLYFQ